MHGSAVNPTLDLIDTIRGEGAFKTLLGALQTVHMVDQLKGSGPFTLFAPSDEAFTKLPPGAVQNLERPVNHAKLIRFLESHLVKGRHGASDLRQRQQIEPAEGAPYAIVSNAAGIRVGNAHLVGHDIACTNGVIHVVDTPLVDL